MDHDPSASERAPGLNTKLMRKAVQERALGIPAADVVLGRFVVLERLGRGGMGEVFAAYDSELDRRVAVKVLRGAGAEKDELLDRRLEREARAMAKLAHPNIVTVHEVGVHEGRLFLVMQHVEGGSLLQWCENNPPARGERFATALLLMRDVAAGLVAAHDVGLVHRDLKPHNILLAPSTSGRPRAMVGDFGLARSGASSSSAGSEPVVLSGDSKLTRTGAAVGTPAYMAPEQFDGIADERSDQFGLCATFYEVFHGVRYTSDAEPKGLVPPWLHRVLDRGLADDPADRFRSVRALLTELDRGDGPRRWPRLVGGLAVVGGASAAIVATSGDAAPPTEPCDDGAAEMQAVLGAEPRAAMRRAFEASGEHYWAQAWSRLEARLDTYAGRWQEAYRDACEATVIRKVQSEETRAARVTCLRQLLEGLGVTVAAFSEATPQLVSDALSVSLALPPVSECADGESVSALSLADPSVAATTAALRRAEARIRVGQLREAEVDAAEAARRAAEVGAPALRSTTALVRSELAFSAGEWDRAETLGLEALGLAELGTDAERMALAWERLSNVAYRRDRIDEAVFRIERASSLADGAGLDATIRGQILATEATAMNGVAPAENVIERRERALQLLREHPSAAARVQVVNVDLTGDLAQVGRIDEALAQGRRSVAELSELYPEGHPLRIVAFGQLAQTLAQVGELDEALTIVDQALESFPPDPRWQVEHRLALTSLRSGILVQLLRLDEAGQTLDDLLRSTDGVVPGDHREVRGARMQLAAIDLERGQPEAALAHLEALGDYGTDEAVHVFNRAAYWGNLAEAQVRTGAVADGLDNLERARALYASAGPNTTWMFLFEVSAAHTLELAGERSRSIAEYEAALSLADEVEVDPTELADARFGLAQALDNQPRARRLAEAARDHYTSLGAAGAAKRAEVEDWLTPRR